MDSLPLPHSSCIVSLRGKTLDLTEYLPHHPGGQVILMRMNGKDITRLFEGRLHSAHAWEVAQTYALHASPPPPSGSKADCESTVSQSEDLAGCQDIADRFEKELEMGGAAPRRESAGCRWHRERRERIVQAHPLVSARLLNECAYFPLTAVAGILGALLHWRVMTALLPALLQAWFAVGADDGDRSLLDRCLQGVLFAVKSLATGPEGTSKGVAESGDLSAISSLCAVVIVVVPLAYFAGACCKMVAFATSHEVAHEAIHPILCDLPESRSLLKVLLLHVINLPSFGATIFEYYHNQHLSHHRFLGGLGVEESIKGFVDGSQSGDGDQLSVNTLLMKQRVHTLQGKPVESLSAAERARAFSSLRLRDVTLTMSDALRGRLQRLEDRFPVATKVLYDIAFHIGYQGLTVGSSVAHILILVGYVALLVADGLLRIMLLCPGPTTIFVGYLRRSFARDYGMTFTKGSLTRMRNAIWSQRDVGVQNVLSIVVLIYACWSCDSEFCNRHRAISSLAMVLYLVLSEMFMFGFLFHPFLAYFLSVHQSHKPVEGSGPCQPTRSIYSRWLSIATFNLTFHVEHHDFPSIAWYYLPRVRESFPEFYDESENSGFRRGVFDVIWSYLCDRDGFVYACSDVA